MNSYQRVDLTSLLGKTNMHDDRRYTIIPMVTRKKPEPETWTCTIHHCRMVKVNDVLRCPQCGNTRIKEDKDDTPKFISGAI
jgi:hypothetical protein